MGRLDSRPKVLLKQFYKLSLLDFSECQMKSRQKLWHLILFGFSSSLRKAAAYLDDMTPFSAYRESAERMALCVC